MSLAPSFFPSVQSPEALSDTLDALLPQLQALSPIADAAGQYPRASIDLLRKAGLLSVALPQSLGGLGFGKTVSFSHYFTMMSRLSSACSNTAQIFSAHCNALLTIAELALPGQLERFSQKVREEGRLFCFVGSEATDRFDANGNRVSFSSQATRVGEKWRITAKKTFATGLPGADWALIHCQNAEDAGADGWLLTVIDLTSPAVTVLDDWDNMGQCATASGKLHITDYLLDDRAVIGGPGAVPRTNRLGPLFQLTFGALLTGIAKGSLDFAIDYVKHHRRPTHGFDSAAHEPANQLRIADDAISVAALDMLQQRAALLLDRHFAGDDVFTETVTSIYQLKIMASRSSVDIASNMFTLLGASATTKALAADRFWRNARTLSLHDNIDKQRALTGRLVLGIEKPQAGIR